MNKSLQPQERAIALYPSTPSDFETPLREAQVDLVDLSDSPQGVILTDGGVSETGFSDYLMENPGVTWVQFPMAGIERFISVVRKNPQVSFTSAKGLFSEPVAEHALTLTLAAMRDLKIRLRATSWDHNQSGVSLYDRRVGIIGAGGIAQEIVRLLKPFRCHIHVFRNSVAPLPQVALTSRTADILDGVQDLDVLIVAAALTEQTRGLINSKVLASMKPSAILVNIARGALVNTADVLEALKSGQISTFACDVTDPEPLPTGHPLWSHPRALITPHTADTEAMIRPLLVRRFTENALAFTSGNSLEGLVNHEAGY